jgi:hypothetical protein
MPKNFPTTHKIITVLFVVLGIIAIPLAGTFIRSSGNDTTRTEAWELTLKQDQDGIQVYYLKWNVNGFQYATVIVKHKDHIAIR